jgi:hypothetical protein
MSVPLSCAVDIAAADIDDETGPSTALVQTA